MFKRVILFDFVLYVPVNNFSVISSTMQGLISLAQGHNAVTPVRLEPATPWSRVKHSTTTWAMFCGKDNSLYQNVIKVNSILAM